MVDILSTAATAAGMSWASGLRLYMALFTAGWLGFMGWVELPPALQVLESPWVLVATGLLTLVEFLADKIPGVDTAWDAVHTFIRIPAGALLAAASFADIDPVWTTIAALIGGSFAAGAHAAKAGGRALINTSPEPVSNWTASFTEDATVAGGLWATFFFPLLLIPFLVIFFVLVIWLVPRFWRGLRTILRRAKA